LFYNSIGNNVKDWAIRSLLPNLVMIEYGRASTTERVLVNDDGLINLSLLKIQSAPLGNLRDQAFDGDKLFILSQTVDCLISC
jgi:hypothetical protein